MKVCTKCGEKKPRECFGTRMDRDKPRPHPTCKPCRVKAAEESRMKQVYGISLAQRDAMLDGQGGKCYICEEDITGTNQCCVDHDHKTGKVRKLLCRTCNLGLGAFQDHPGLLRMAAEYLEEHNVASR